MFALVQTGGKQYKVRVGMNLAVEKLDGAVGDVIDLSNVLLINKDGDVTVGAPLVVGAVVKASVVAQKRDRKVIIFKKSRRKNYRRKNGHRQPKTVLHIDAIVC